MWRTPHAIDARLPPFLRLLDGVQVDNPTHWLISNLRLRGSRTETFAALGLSSTFDRSRVEVTLQLARVFSSLFTLLFVVRISASLTITSKTDDENHAGTSPSGRFAPSTTRAETHTYWNYRPRSHLCVFYAPCATSVCRSHSSTRRQGLIYAAESGSNTQITDFFDALYFGLTTLTTVGFGDITPVTPVGRLIVSASTVVGIALVPLQLTGLAETLLKETRAREAQQKKPMGYRVDRLARRCECLLGEGAPKGRAVLLPVRRGAAALIVVCFA